jgi:hypothetical protein
MFLGFHWLESVKYEDIYWYHFQALYTKHPFIFSRTSNGPRPEEGALGGSQGKLINTYIYPPSENNPYLCNSMEKLMHNSGSG